MKPEHRQQEGRRLVRRITTEEIWDEGCTVDAPRNGIDAPPPSPLSGADVGDGTDLADADLAEPQHPACGCPATRVIERYEAEDDD